MIAELGRRLIAQSRNLLYVTGFMYSVFRETFLFPRRKQVGFRVLVMQILFTGVGAFGIISLLSLALGAVIIVEGISILPKFGQGSLIYTILVIVITREISAIFTAFIIVARSGTAIATELGNMVVSHEIEAYLSVGINPISYLVVPRFLGVIIAQVTLSIYFNLAGLFGSFLISQFVKRTPFLEYFRNLLTTIQLVDLLSLLVKSLVFGTIISLVATYQGLRVSASVTEIPQVAIRAVGLSFGLCILADALITLIYYL